MASCYSIEVLHIYDGSRHYLYKYFNS